MKRETIEQAAHEYAESIPQSDERKEYSREDFIAGVEWHIKSSWHDATKFKPRRGSKVAVLTSEEDIAIWNFENGMEQAFSCMGIKRWAYLDDLLPERKEVEK